MKNNKFYEEREIFYGKKEGSNIHTSVVKLIHMNLIKYYNYLKKLDMML